MEKLNFYISSVLKSSFEVSISGPLGSKKFHGFKDFAEFPSKPLWKYVIVSLFKTVFLSIKIKPQLVLCGSGSAILAGYFSSRITSAKLVCYLHGLDIIVDSFLYQYFFLPFVRRSDRILVNSHHTRDLAIAAGILPEKIEVISPGTSLPDLSHKPHQSNLFRQKYDLGDAPILLIAGRIMPRKGIAEFIDRLMPSIIELIPNVQLLIVGSEATEAISVSVSLRDKILEKVSSRKLENNVKLLGAIDDDLLSAAFFSSEILVFPVLNLPNDVEGFGMVAIEAAAHGLPTIGFSVGGVADAISHGESGWLIPAGDYGRMLDVIVARLQHAGHQAVNVSSCVNYASKFEWDEFGKKLNSLLFDIK